MVTHDLSSKPVCIFALYVLTLRYVNRMRLFSKLPRGKVLHLFSGTIIAAAAFLWQLFIYAVARSRKPLSSLQLFRPVRVCGRSARFRTVTSASRSGADDNKGLIYDSVCADYLPCYLCSDRSWCCRPIAGPTRGSIQATTMRASAAWLRQSCKERATRHLFVLSSALFGEGQLSEVSLSAWSAVFP